MKTSIHPQPGHVLILGLGISGRAAARLALLEGEDVWGVDSGHPDGELVAEFRQLGAHVLTGWDHSTWSGNPKLAVISPGIAPNSLLGKLADGLSCPVISELEYGFQHCRAPVLAVTGTNGKTTTVECLAHCLKAAGKKIRTAGNIGQPLSDPDICRADLDFIVAEVSSYQLERIRTFSPAAAAVLNLTPDHLDRYAGFEEYCRVKARLLACLEKPSLGVVRRDLLEMPGLSALGSRQLQGLKTFSAKPGETADFGVSKDGRLLEKRGAESVPVMEVAELKIQGRHNVENVLAALALADAVGIPPMNMACGLRTFAASAHRLELVGVFDQVTFINDSKATNPDALIRALEAVGDPRQPRILLLAGGLDKDLDFASVKPLLARFCKAVFLIGKCRERLADQWGDVVSCKVFNAMGDAVDSAADFARPDDVVLLSPGCASMDMFANYAERGLFFKRLVRRKFKQ